MLRRDYAIDQIYSTITEANRLSIRGLCLPGVTCAYMRLNPNSQYDTLHFKAHANLPRAICPFDKRKRGLWTMSFQLI